MTRPWPARFTGKESTPLTGEVHKQGTMGGTREAVPPDLLR